MIKAILACDDEWGIGKDGDLPWPHNPADLKWFKKNTLNCMVIMGKSTWDSLPRKPLPNRENMIVTKAKQEFGFGDYEFANFSEAKSRILDIKDKEARINAIDGDVHVDQGDWPNTNLMKDPFLLMKVGSNEIKYIIKRFKMWLT